MDLYKRLYHLLFNAITDALCELDADRGENAAEILEKAQLCAEELYIEYDLPHEDIQTV